MSTAASEDDAAAVLARVVAHGGEPWEVSAKGLGSKYGKFINNCHIPDGGAFDRGTRLVGLA